MAIPSTTGTVPRASLGISRQMNVAPPLEQIRRRLRQDSLSRPSIPVGFMINRFRHPTATVLSDGGRITIFSSIVQYWQSRLTNSSIGVMIAKMK